MSIKSAHSEMSNSSGCKYRVYLKTLKWKKVGVKGMWTQFSRWVASKKFYKFRSHWQFARSSCIANVIGCLQQDSFRIDGFVCETDVPIFHLILVVKLAQYWTFFQGKSRCCTFFSNFWNNLRNIGFEQPSHSKDPF